MSDRMGTTHGKLWMANLFWCCLAALLAGCSLPPLSPGWTGAAPDSGAQGKASELPQVTVVLRKSDDSATITSIPDQVVIDFVSPSGIGGATAAIEPGPMPKAILLRFELKGLEGLDFSYGQTQIHVSVPTNGDEPMESVTELGTSAVSITPDSPYWMPVTRSNTALNAPGAYIQVAAPDDFIDNGVRAFTVQWVDFYR
jgi:hypothetical protein